MDEVGKGFKFRTFNKNDSDNKFDEVDQVAKNMLENKTFGRIVVDVNL